MIVYDSGDPNVYHMTNRLRQVCITMPYVEINRHLMCRYSRMYDIAIVGAGPTGLALADLVSRQGHSVAIIERASGPGGCWRIDWEQGLMTEHSPKVVFSDQKFLKSVLRKYRSDNMVPAYGGSPNVVGAVLRSFSPQDYLILGLAVTRNTVAPYGVTVDNWLSNSGMSEGGKKLVREISLALAQGPSMPISLVLETMVPWRFVSGSNPMSIVDQEVWLNAWWKDIVSRPNVSYQLNTDAIHLVSSDEGQVQSVITTRSSVECRQCVLAVPPAALASLLERSGLQENWDGVLPEPTMPFLERSSYTGIGFQLHFSRETPTYNKRWCRSCDNIWSIISLPVSSTWRVFTHDPSIVEVWSCVVVDTKVPVQGRYIHEMTPDQFVAECLRQLSSALGFDVVPDRTTVHADVEPNGRISRIQRDSAFGITLGGALPPRGTVRNLWCIGPQNSDAVATIERGLEAAVNVAPILCKELSIL